MQNVNVENGPVKIGDVVEFKSDIEQCGRVVAIKRSVTGFGFDLVLEPCGDEPFEGGYIGGQFRTVESAKRCSI